MNQTTTQGGAEVKKSGKKEDRKFSHKELLSGLKAIYSNALGYRKLFATALSISIAFAIISPLDTLLLGRFIDSLSHIGTAEGTRMVLGYAIPTFIGILFLWACAQIAEVFLTKYRVLSCLKLEEYTRTAYIVKVAGHLFRMPLSFHKTNKMGEVQERTTMAASAMGSILGNDLVTVLPQFVSSIIILSVIFSLNIYLFLLVLVTIIAFIYVTVITVRPMVPLQRENQRIYAKVRGGIIDAIMNIRIVKDFTSEKYQSDQALYNYQQQAMPVWYRLMGLRRNQSAMQDILIFTCRTIMLLSSAYLVYHNLWTIGSLVVANAYLNQLFRPIRDISNNWRNIQNGIIAIEDTEAILAQPTEEYDPKPVLLGKAQDEAERTSLTNLQGKVEFKNVSFSYSADKAVLRNVSFVANPGEVIAIVGESGVGKSSLIDLISAYDFARDGEVLIDDVSIRDIALTKLRHNIGVVTQELTLFNDTIKNNIRYGNFNRTDEEVLAASRKAHCYDFIEKFPEKWEQLVGERGLKLSVGQKQRVAIARAILKNPRILILDEPTSALDASSERIITESLEELMKGKTTFIVAHRLSTVRRADKILVFKDGTIVESGTHSELVGRQGGEYRRLHELQSGLSGSSNAS